MKTRQEATYDFMLALSANPAIFKDWVDSGYELGGYGEHLASLAEELTVEYLNID